MGTELDLDNLEFSAPTVADNERFDSPKSRSNFTIGFCSRKNGTEEFRPCANKAKEGDEGCRGCVRFSNYGRGDKITNQPKDKHHGCKEES